MPRHRPIHSLCVAAACSAHKLVQLAKRLGGAMAEAQSAIDEAGMGELGPEKLLKSDLLALMQQVEVQPEAADANKPVQTRRQVRGAGCALQRVEESNNMLCSSSR